MSAVIILTQKFADFSTPYIGEIECPFLGILSLTFLYLHSQTETEVRC